MRVFVVDSGTYGSHIEGVFRDDASARSFADSIPDAAVRAWSVLRDLPTSIPRFGPIGADAPATDTADHEDVPRVLFLVMTGEWSDYHLEAVVADEDMAHALETHWSTAIVTVERVEIGESLAEKDTWIARLALGTGDVSAAQQATAVDPAGEVISASGVRILRRAWGTRVGVLSDESVFAWGRTAAEAMKRARDFRASYLAAPDAAAMHLIGVCETNGLPELDRLANDLHRAMESARTAFSGMTVSAARSPGRPELAAVLGCTSTLATALAALLDALDRALGNEGVEPWLPLVSLADVRGFLSRWFPIPKTSAEARPDHTRPTGLIVLLGAFYGAVNEFDNSLLRRKIPKSFVWWETVDLWTSIIYLGGTHAGGGLPSRLDRIALLSERRSSPRGSTWYPWDRADIARLNEIARRCDFLVTATDAEVLARMSAPPNEER